MNKEFYQTQAFTFLTILVVGTACSGQVKKDPDTHPKLIKTIGSPRYGNVQCGLQDKAGNLWFGGNPPVVDFFPSYPRMTGRTTRP